MPSGEAFFTSSACFSSSSVFSPEHPAIGTPEELDGWIDENVTRWAEVIEANNISL